MVAPQTHWGCQAVLFIHPPPKLFLSVVTEFSDLPSVSFWEVSKSPSNPVCCSISDKCPLRNISGRILSDHYRQRSKKTNSTVCYNISERSQEYSLRRSIKYAIRTNTQLMNIVSLTWRSSKPSTQCVIISHFIVKSGVGRC